VKSLLSRFAVPIIAVSIFLLFGLCTVFGFSLKNAQGAELKGKFGLDQLLGHKLPLSAHLVDEQGKDVKLGDYFGKRPVVLLFGGFTCDGACLTEFEGAAQTLADIKDKSAGTDYDVVAISIDPRETSKVAGEKKKELLQEYGRPDNGGWHFLTGDEKQVSSVAAAAGYKYYFNAEKDQLANPTALFVVTADGRLSKYFFGTEYVASLVSDSTSDAAKGKIGTPNEPQLMACLKYDPTHNKTRQVVFVAIKIAGFSTLIALAASIFFMSRNPSQPKRITDKEDFFRS
jgi:protein SCO1/2